MEKGETRNYSNGLLLSVFGADIWQQYNSERRRYED